MYKPATLCNNTIHSDSSKHAGIKYTIEAIAADNVIAITYTMQTAFNKA
jgi:hypothetical protein